eukprot:3662883-Prymnesium_polylepis.1
MSLECRDIGIARLGSRCCPAGVEPVSLTAHHATRFFYRHAVPREDRRRARGRRGAGSQLTTPPPGDARDAVPTCRSP